ncbi:MAG: propionyl-CoA synthetase [Cytophagales bacterium]|nr:MAG: propionyl-CoA synthetase [Cytophagales bacterium]
MLYGIFKRKNDTFIISNQSKPKLKEAIIMKNYQEMYEYSIQNPVGFWADQATQVAWYQAPTQILTQDNNGLYRWFKGGTLNSCYLALDHHIQQGKGENIALIYDSPVTNTIKKYTYTMLQQEVALFAGVLRDLGVEKGDRVVIYMPMIPEAAIAMLATARLGAIHSVVFGGFAPHELAIRIDDARPKVVVSASCGIEFTKNIAYKPLLDAAIEESFFKPQHTVIYQRPMEKATLNLERDHDWETLMQKATPADCVPVEATDPLYILYTSGTTGKPKGIVRDNGGHAVAMYFSMQYVYGGRKGDVFWAASDVGWVVGHSYIVYAPLMNGLTTLLFEGKPIKTPDAGTFWRVIAEHKVNIFFSAPTAFRAIKKEDSEGILYQKYDTSSLRTLFVAGERCDVATYQWLSDLLKIPIIDHWWQTESGFPMLANMAGVGLMPIKPGSAGKCVWGFNIQILTESGDPVTHPREEGAVVIKLPMPPGCLPTLWGDDERFKSSYLDTFEGYYLSGDGGYKDEEGYFYITGRIDDVINVAGHRLSTAEMEEMVAAHPAVAECAVIGIADELKGQRPIGLVVLKDNHSITETTLEEELIQKIRHEIGALAFFRNAIIVKRLPKTRSGKILRKIMRKIADGEAFTMPSTIDDPAILDEIKENLEKHQIGLAFTK